MGSNIPAAVFYLIGKDGMDDAAADNGPVSVLQVIPLRKLRCQKINV